MCFLDILREARSRSTSTLHKFKLNSGTTDPQVHLFFEGKDEESFYSCFCDPIFRVNTKVFKYRCGSKAALLKLRQTILDLSDVQKDHLLFFVDKDHDDFLGKLVPSDVFVTRYYSIESEVAIPEVVHRFLRDVLHLDDHTVESMIIGKFSDCLSSFHQKMLSPSAWIICARMNGSDPRLDDIRLAQWFEISNDLDLVDKRTRGTTVPELQRCDAVGPESFRVLLMMCKRLRTVNPKIFVRGKFEKWLVVQFLMKVVHVLKHTASSDSKISKQRTALSLKNAMEILGPRCPIPDDLDSFLHSRFGN